MAAPCSAFTATRRTTPTTLRATAASSRLAVAGTTSTPLEIAVSKLSKGPRKTRQPRKKTVRKKEDSWMDVSIEPEFDSIEEAEFAVREQYGGRGDNNG